MSGPTAIGRSSWSRRVRASYRQILTQTSASRNARTSTPFEPETVDPVGDRELGRGPARRGGWRARRGPRRAPRPAPASGSTATWLTDATRWTMASGVIACSCRNSAVWSGPKPGRSRVGAVAPLVVVAPRRPLLDAVHDRPHLVDPRRRCDPARSTRGRRRPPGRRTRASVGDARGRGRTSGTPARRSPRRATRRGTASCLGRRRRRSGRRAAIARNVSRMPATGSTAIRSAPVGASSRVSLPVPAARSTTRLPGSIRRFSTSQADRVGRVRRPRRFVVGRVGEPRRRNLVHHAPQSFTRPRVDGRSGVGTFDSLHASRFLVTLAR